MFVCDKCRANIAEGYKFCPECGDPVTDADRVQETVITVHGKVPEVSLSFGYSSSSNYARAVSMCDKNPTYKSEGEGKEIRHSLTLPITEAELLGNLYDLVGSWKSSFMLIDGVNSTKKDLVYGGVGCFRERQKAYDQKQYCFGNAHYDRNIWGCKRLNMPIYEYGGGWLEYGAFDKNGVWFFDKKRIAHELEVALEENKLCPALNRGAVLETLAKFPDSVNPKKDDNWRYRTTTERAKNGRWVEVAVGVSPVMTRANAFIITPYKPSWESEFDDSEEDIEDEVVFVDTPETQESEQPLKAMDTQPTATWQDKVKEFAVEIQKQPEELDLKTKIIIWILFPLTIIGAITVVSLLFR